VIVFSLLQHQLCGETKALFLSSIVAEFPLHAAKSTSATSWKTRVQFWPGAMEMLFQFNSPLTALTMSI